jgi:hypothetical protein
LTKKPTTNLQIPLFLFDYSERKTSSSSSIYFPQIKKETPKNTPIGLLLLLSCVMVFDGGCSSIVAARIGEKRDRKLLLCGVVAGYEEERA